MTDAILERIAGEPAHLREYNKTAAKERTMSEPLGAPALPMPLAPFEAAIHGDGRVLGMLYTGSLGRGSADRFSDLDLELWVTASAFAQAETTARHILNYLGPIHFAYPRDQGWTACTAFVGGQWQRVDLVLHPDTEGRPLSAYAHARLIKDTNRFLEHLLSEAKEDAVAVSWEQARAGIEEAIDSQLYVSLHNARGAIWSALGEVSYRATELYGMLAAFRGAQSYGYRYVEHLLSPHEQTLLTQAWPTQPSQQEVRRAARALAMDALRLAGSRTAPRSSVAH
jgi:hypothetical protein